MRIRETESLIIDRSKSHEIQALKIRLNCPKRTVSIENKSNRPIYWLSPGEYSNIPQSEVVSHRLDPKESAIVYNLDQAQFNRLRIDPIYRDILDMDSVYVSFDCYWGSDSNRRKSIEFCPSWININFSLI